MSYPRLPGLALAFFVLIIGGALQGARAVRLESCFKVPGIEGACLLCIFLHN